MNTNKRKLDKKLLYFSIVLIIVYLIATIAFYYLAGEQLRIRESRGNIHMPIADSGTVELIVGNVVEQHFTAEIQRLKSIDIQWGTYYRANNGTVCVEVYDTRNGSLLMNGIYDMATIPEGGITTLVAPTPVENVYGVHLTLRIYTTDAQAGSAISPLMNTQCNKNGFSLYLNNVETNGMLCFAANGEDYIWTGLHYWKFVVVGFALLLVCELSVLYRVRNNKRSYIANAFAAMQKYRFLIRQLVSRDFKTKYKRSVLGVLWSFLNPLLMMIVQYFVFSTIFRADIEHYPVYLLMGIVAFNFFSEACGMSLTSILGNAGLITKVYVPKYIYPLTRVISSIINFAISLILLVIVSLVTGVHFEKSAVLTLYFFACLIVFSFGLGLLLSASMVFFRDTQFLWGVLSTIWMYATPIFYPESIIPEKFKFVHQINPLYHFLKNARMCVLQGISPEPVVYVQCLLIAMVMLAIGAFIFRKSQDKFVLYL